MVAGPLRLLIVLFVVGVVVRLAIFPPSGAFPGAIAVIDGEFNRQWWGCLKLPSGDAREVGSYDERALFFIPGGKCEKQPPLPSGGEHLFFTWRQVREKDSEPLGSIRLIVPGGCPVVASNAARDEALRLLGEYLDARTGPDRYHDDAMAARVALQGLKGPTRPLREDDPGGQNESHFDGGLWGPAPRPGTYPVCIQD